jgi:putative hemolysin
LVGVNETAMWLPWLALVPLLVASAFCSASETVVFGLTGGDRDWLRREQPATSGRVERLLAEPRGVLVTVLLGNMTVNTLYFVVSTGLMLWLDLPWWKELAVTVTTLLALVLFGETLPKLASNIGRRRLAPWVAAPLLAMHRALTPVHRLVEQGIVVPLTRLAGPAPRSEVEQAELAELLAMSQASGVLAPEEGAAIRRVTRLGRRRVREVMTPRVHLEWIHSGASHAEVLAEARRCRRRRLIVADPDLDQVVGWLDVRKYLLDARGARTPMADHVSTVGFVPELATIEHLLGWFARSGQRLAVAVDEFGGTAGLVTLRDALGEIGGHEAEAPSEGWIEAGRGLWTGPGDADLTEAFERFGLHEPESVSDTVAGAIMERLGRVAREGDEVQLAAARLKVTRMIGARIDRVQWTLEAVQ